MRQSTFDELQRQVTTLQRKADQAEGALKRIKDDIAELIGKRVNTIEEAERELAKMEKEIEVKRSGLDKAIQAFEEKHGNAINA